MTLYTHFDAYYQEHVAVYRIEPIEMIAAELPKRRQRLVEAWAELHQQELTADRDGYKQGANLCPLLR